MECDKEEVDAPNDLLFEGDTGTLAMETRRTFIQILSGPCLDGKRQPKLWTTLLRDEAVIRSRLFELFIELVIDREQEVAFTRQAEVGDLEVPVLLRRSQLSFIDSVLLLHLRQKLSRADANAERAVVERSEILEHLSIYDRNANTDRVGFNKKISASIEKFRKNNILQAIRSSADRFEIIPTLKLLFSAEEIIALTTAYSNCSVDGQKVTTGPDDDGLE